MAVEIPKSMPKHNLLLLGKIGAGKSTLVKHITGTSVFHLFSDVDSMTRVPTFVETMDFESPHNVRYKVKKLDTTGLVSDPGVTKESIVREIKRYCDEKRNDGDSMLVLFVVPNDRYTDEDWNIFQSITEFPRLGLSAVSALVVTRCEDLHDEARGELVGEICNSALTADIARFMGKGIHPVGFPDPAKLKPGMIDAYEDGIKRDKETLRQLFSDTGRWQPPNEHSPPGRIHPSNKETTGKCTVM